MTDKQNPGAARTAAGANRNSSNGPPDTMDRAGGTTRKTVTDLCIVVDWCATPLDPLPRKTDTT